MVLLSQLLRFHVIDDHGRRARLVDVSLVGLAADYPEIAQLLVRYDRRGLRLLPWSAVTGFDRRARLARVADLEAGTSVPEHDWPAGIWLARDVLDATVINIWHRHVTVANDLLLSGGRGGLRLRAAATGLRAILPRLTGRFYRLHTRRSLYDWRHIEFVPTRPAQPGADAAQSGAGPAQSDAGSLPRVARLPPGEIAHLAAPLPYGLAAQLLSQLPPALAVDTLEEMPLDRQVQLFEELADERALAVLEDMAPDVAADLLGRLEQEPARRWLERLSPAKAEQLIELLRYPANTVGGAMTNDIVRVPAGLTVGQVRQTMRPQLAQPDFPYFLYVVDDERRQRLLGVLSLRGFVTADDQRSIGELMNRDLLKLTPLEAPRPAAFRVLESGLAALPVVDAHGHLLGVLTVDAAVALVAPRGWTTQAPRVFS